jgi:putative endonuclease
MATHNDLGKLGEELAIGWLKRHGHQILYQNWRYSHYELDLVTLKKETLHIVEVKLRTSTQFGMPEQAVSRKKYRDLMKAADEFLTQHLQYRYVQLDILSISKINGGEWEYFLIEDVFYN